MAEYIKREEIYDDFEKCNGENPKWTPSRVKTLIARQKAADVAPVRHGRWEEMHYEGGILDGTNFDRCTVCGYERVFENPALKTVFKYCPNCGARMDKEALECDT